MEKHNDRLTTGWYAVYKQDEECFFSLAADQWTDVLLSL